VKIDLRILFQAEAKPALRETDLFSNEELEAVVLDLDSQSERFARFVQATRNTTTGSWFNPIMTFTRKELDSAAVRDCFIRNKFKGWAFRPVLSKGSEMHRQYEALWDALFKKISINPLNFF
jgi:hypothetical protein